MTFLRKLVEWCWNNDFQMENLVQRFKELTLYAGWKARLAVGGTVALIWGCARCVSTCAAPLDGRASSPRPLTPTLQQLGQDSSAEDLAFLTAYLSQSNLTAHERMLSAVRRTGAPRRLS